MNLIYIQSYIDLNGLLISLLALLSWSLIMRKKWLEPGSGLTAEKNCTWCAAGKYQSGSGVHQTFCPPLLSSAIRGTWWLPTVVGRV
jgi:hypothetical protein